MPSLRHLQEHLPWTIPYTAEFKSSFIHNPLRGIGHDVLHVMKSLGRIAAEVEAGDHARPRKLIGQALAKEVADLVICALHIAKAEGFDLQDAVIENSEARNAANIPVEKEGRAVAWLITTPRGETIHAGEKDGWRVDEVMRDPMDPSPWNPVKDRLPRKPGEYFCRCNTEYTTILYFVDGNWLESDKMLASSREHDREEGYWNRFVTHWMPLPGKPE